MNDIFSKVSLDCESPIMGSINGHRRQGESVNFRTQRSGYIEVNYHEEHCSYFYMYSYIYCFYLYHHYRGCYLINILNNANVVAKKNATM